MANEAIERAITLNEQAKLKKDKGFAAFHASVTGEIEKYRKGERDAFDTKNAESARRAAAQSGEDRRGRCGRAQADMERSLRCSAKKVPRPQRHRARGHPNRNSVPGTGVFALGATDVTRGARPSRWRPSGLREMPRFAPPFAPQDLSWRTGFMQNDDIRSSVSWNDAKAYSDWLAADRAALPPADAEGMAHRRAAPHGELQRRYFGDDTCSDGYPTPRLSCTSPDHLASTTWPATSTYDRRLRKRRRCIVQRTRDPRLVVARHLQRGLLQPPGHQRERHRGYATPAVCCARFY
jgi:hypothetical protein